MMANGSGLSARTLRFAALSVSLCFGCTSSPERDVGATAIGTGAGVIACIATVFVCPAALIVGAGGGILIRKINVSRNDGCMRRTRIANVRVRQAYCDHG
jgi:hypothetical protein